MTRRSRTLITLVTGAGLAAAMASPVAAAARPGHFDFYDCTGPAGTPTSFLAIKENVPAHGGSSSAAVAYRIDGGGVFVVQAFGDSKIGNGIPDANLVVSCQITFPEFGTFTFSGFITPRG